MHPDVRWYFAPFLFIVLAVACSACTTVGVSPSAAFLKRPICSHSNDGDGDVAGYLHQIPSQSFPSGALRHVKYGNIPQVSHTYAYKTEGYAIVNEYKVGLCESTCSGKFDSKHGWGSRGLLTIVDLSQIALERTKTAREAIETMGALSEKYGYQDAGESLFVVDEDEIWVFHILPDDSNASSIWAAQRLEKSEVAVVANAFIIQGMDFPLTQNGPFMGSSNLKSIAIRHNWYNPTEKFDFSRAYSRGELGPKYNSGRRMWEGFRLLSPDTKLSPTYQSFQGAYPTTVDVPRGSVNASAVFKVMRSYYQGTIYDLSKAFFSSPNKIAGGPFGTSFRAGPGKGEASFPDGRWERSIATWKSQVSYVLDLGGMTDKGLLWFAPHAAHTSVYVPFVAAGAFEIPTSFSNPGGSIMPPVDRTRAFWANRYVFHMAQLHFLYAIEDVKRVRAPIEQASLALVTNLSSDGNMTEVVNKMNENANRVVEKWWDFGENLLAWYGEGNCNHCGKSISHHIGYEPWWLEASGYNTPEPQRAPFAAEKSEDSTIANLITSLSDAELDHVLAQIHHEKSRRRR